MNKVKSSSSCLLTSIRKWFRHVWQIVSSIFQDFIWADIKQGRIDLQGLPFEMRLIVVGGMAIVIGLLLLLLFNEYLRSTFSLLPIPGTHIFAAGRGVLIPTILVPITLFCVGIAWSFALTGSLHSHIIVRILVLILFLLTAIRQIWGQILIMYYGRIGIFDIVLLVVMFMATIAVPLFFLLAHFMKIDPALEFVVILLLVSSIFIITQLKNVAILNQIGLPIGLVYLQLNIVDFGMIVIPFLLQLGLDIADFAMRFTGWIKESVILIQPRWGIRFLLVVSLLVRSFFWVKNEFFSSGNAVFKNSLMDYVGALGEIVCVLILWFVLMRIKKFRFSGEDQAEALLSNAKKSIFPLVVGFAFPFIIVFIISQIISAIPIPVIVYSLGNFSDVLPRIISYWQIIVGVLVVIVAFIFARRGCFYMAFYLGLVGVLRLYSELTTPGNILGDLYWKESTIGDFWWVVMILAGTLFWLVKGKLSEERAEILLYLMIVILLMKQTRFISEPFSPIFGFAGVGFVAFGIIWDMMTSGSWANKSTKGFNRQSRIFFYLGYVILTATVINWTLTTHDLTSLSQVTGKTALAGFNGFGRPLLYSVFLVLFFGLFEGERMEAELKINTG